MELYEKIEDELERDNKKHTFYKNVCFISIGLAVGSIISFNIVNGNSESLSEASIISFIAGSLGALYSKMTKDIYKSSINSKKNILSTITPILSPEQMESIKTRKIEMQNLKKELELIDMNYKDSSKKLKRFSI